VNRRGHIAALVLLLSAVAVVIAQVDISEDPPLPKPENGDVSGVVTPAEQVESLKLVSRATGEEYEAKSFDAETGKVVFEYLPGDAVYDVCIATTDGRAVEGIDLSFVDARLIRLAEQRRAELGVEATPRRNFTADDAEDIMRFVDDLEDFMDLRRVLYIAGWGGRATALVELMRIRDFHADDGEVIWRIELWYFVYHSNGWQRVANQNRVLRRVRTTPDEWAKIAVEYRPQLSVTIDEQGACEPVNFEIPSEIDPSRGRPAGTNPQLDTQPHILGIDEESPEDDMIVL